jgi:hypothetical protein
MLSAFLTPSTSCSGLRTPSGKWVTISRLKTKCGMVQIKCDKLLMLQRDLCSNGRPGLLDFQDSKRKTRKVLPL